MKQKTKLKKTEIGLIPENWNVVDVGNFVEIKHGYAFKGKFFTDEENQNLVLSPGNFHVGGGFKGDKFKYTTESYPDDYVLKEGNIIVTMTDLSKKGDTLGYAAKIPKPHGNKYLHNQRLGLLQFNSSDICPDFLYWILRTKNYNWFVVGSATGSTVKHTSPSRIKQYTFACPKNLLEQRVIAHILSTLDDKIHLNTQINQTLESMAQAIFKSWFVDFEPVKAKIAAIEAGEDPESVNRAAMRAISGKSDDELDKMQAEQPDEYAQLEGTAELFPAAMWDSELGEVPEGWDISNVGKVSTCFDKNRIPLSKREREQKKGSIPYYGATSIMDYVDESIFEGIYLLLGEDGSVVKEDGSPFVQYVWGQFWANNHAHVLQGANGVSTEHLMLFMQNQNIAPYVTGAVQLKLNQRNMNSIPFIDAGKSINYAFYNSISPLYSFLRNSEEEIRNLSNIRDTLLPKLLSGELSVENIELNEANV